MTKRLQNLPEESSPELESLARDADKLQAIKALYDTEGGKELAAILTQDVVNAVYHLRSSYKTATHTELISLIAALDERLSLVNLIKRAKDNLELIDQDIADALSE